MPVAVTVTLAIAPPDVVTVSTAFIVTLLHAAPLRVHDVVTPR